MLLKEKKYYSTNINLITLSMSSEKQEIHQRGTKSHKYLYYLYILCGLESPHSISVFLYIYFFAFFFIFRVGSPHLLVMLTNFILFLGSRGSMNWRWVFLFQLH